MNQSQCLIPHQAEPTGSYVGADLKITGHKKMAMKTVANDEAASHDDKAAPSGVAPIVDIATFMKQPFTETDFLDDK